MKKEKVENLIWESKWWYPLLMNFFSNYGREDASKNKILEASLPHTSSSQLTNERKS